MKKPMGTATHDQREESSLSGLNHDAIAVRAYELWMSRGCPDGSPEVDWLQAEAELTREPQAAAVQSQAA